MKQPDKADQILNPTHLQNIPQQVLPRRTTELTDRQSTAPGPDLLCATKWSTARGSWRSSAQQDPPTPGTAPLLCSQGGIPPSVLTTHSIFLPLPITTSSQNATQNAAHSPDTAQPGHNTFRPQGPLRARSPRAAVVEPPPSLTAATTAAPGPAHTHRAGTAEARQKGRTAAPRRFLLPLPASPAPPAAPARACAATMSRSSAAETRTRSSPSAILFRAGEGTAAARGQNSSRGARRLTARMRTARSGAARPWARYGRPTWSRRWSGCGTACGARPC